VKCLLLVEDEESIRSQLRELLEDEGYAVVEAHNGQEALAAMNDGLDPAVVLLDLMMPVMDGWELLERMRCHQRLAKVPVVVASAVADSEGLPAGVRFLRKPFCVNALLDTVQDQCACTV
jgi:CheY-like chemotaxis protein